MKNLQQLREVSIPTGQDHIDMISQPTFWPKYPFLPLTKIVKGEKKLGFLFDNSKNKDNKYEVIIGNLYSLMMDIPTIDKLLKMPVENYNSIELLLADGWIVD